MTTPETFEQPESRRLLDRLVGRISEFENEGCRVVSFGNVRVPDGYAVLLNADESHYFWICGDGRESVMHWNKWAVLRGAKEDTGANHGAD